jgi:glycosyltransferase involved in cell wall biosynthesis
MPEMAEKRVIFVISNSPDRDIRVLKESRTLKQAGYAAALLYWDRGSRSNRVSGADDYGEMLRLRLKAPAGLGLTLLLPAWWSYVFVRLLFKKWDVVQALNFHSIVPSLIAARLKRKRAIYEIIDFYEWRTPRFIRAAFLKLDKLFMRLADAVIVADEAQIEGIGGIPNPNVFPIYDSPPDTLDSDDALHLGHYGDKPFTLFYAGALYKDRRLNLDKVFEAIRDLEGIRLLVAGYGDLVGEIKEWSRRWPDKLEFIGQIDYAEVLKRGVKTHLFFVLRDQDVPTNRFTCGSTIFNAMICGKPILVNQGTSTTVKVTREDCGLAVNPGDVAGIKQAIVTLRDDPGLYRRLGANARRAYEERYSWALMAQRLLALYDKLNQEVNGAG